MDEVVVLTNSSPNWGALRELRVFGRIPAISDSEEEAPAYDVNAVATGLAYPVSAMPAGYGSGRIFVVERQVRIRIIKDGVTSDIPFLDIAERVNCCRGERGPFGLAFPPTILKVVTFT